MAEKDIKKSLSLKSHKSSGGKQSKPSVGSKNVKIQVKRKKIIIPSESEKNDSLLETDESLVVSKDSPEISGNEVKPKNIENAITMLTVNNAIAIPINIIIELVSVKSGLRTPRIAVLVLLIIPLITSLLLRDT